MITIYIENLFQLIDAFCKIGETLDMAVYRRQIRCFKIIIDDNAKKVDAILDSNKVLLNDYDVLKLDVASRLDVFNAFQTMLYAYKTMSKRLLAFKEDCDVYKCRHENTRLFKQIKDEVTLLLERTVDQITYISESMIMLVDKGNFLKRSYSQIDETLDKDYLLERSTIDERIQELFESDNDSDLDSTVHIASEIKKDADDKKQDDADGNQDVKTDSSSDKCSFQKSSESSPEKTSKREKTSDNSGLESSSDSSKSSDKDIENDIDNDADKNIDKNNSNSNSENRNDDSKNANVSTDEDFKILPSKHVMEDKPVNDENSFDQ